MPSPLPAVVKVGAVLTALMLTVVLPVAVRGPPAPCAPVLPSSKVQSICAVAGGEPELLA